MNRFRKGDWGLKLLSLLMAVVLWVYVADEQNPPEEREFKAVPVETRGLGPDMTVLQAPGTVNISVQANRNIMSELSLRSIEVYVDLSGAKPGRNNVPVLVKVPPEVVVTGLAPKNVEITLDILAERQVPVKVKFSGQPAAGYRVMNIKTNPEEIILRGPKSIIDRVASADIDIKVNDRDRTFGESVPVRISDRSGNFLEEKVVKRSPQTVDVVVTIAEEKPSKTVPVVANITGQPADGSVVTGTVVEPASVVITGNRSAIDGISELTTQPVDIAGAATDLQLEVSPVLPAGVTADRQTVRVLVKIEPRQAGTD